MPITGRLTTAGHITLATCPPHDIPENTTYEDVQGVVLEMDEANTRAACGRFLTQRVAIWAADELVPRAGSPAMEPTPENMQHLAMRLEAAEEHLAREVRSNEAATRVRVDLEARCGEADECLASRLATIGKMRGERDAALAEVTRQRAECERLSAAIVDREADFREQQAACMRAVKANMDLGAEVDRLAAELADALSRLAKTEAELSAVWQPQGGCQADLD